MFFPDYYDDHDYWYDDDEPPRCPYCGSFDVCEEWCETERPAQEPAPTDDNLTTTPSNDPSS